MTTEIEKCCIHGFVSGRVQGVWFRAFTKEQSIACNVNGWAKNLADGRVEVMLAGNSIDVERVIRALYQGPPLAEVSTIKTETLPYRHYDTFSTG